MAALRPLQGMASGFAGWALGLAIGYHPTLVMLALPVGVVLIIESSNWKSAATLAGGALAGILPFWALTRWVCHPYGDWTRWSVLQKLLVVTPEHHAMAMGLLLAGIMGAGLIVLCRIRPVRNWLLSGWRRSVLTLLLFLACTVLMLLPWLLDGLLAKGWSSIWTGIRWGAAGLALAGAASMFVLKRPIR